MRISLRVHPVIAWVVILLCLATLFLLFWPVRQVTAQLAALLVILLCFRYTPPVMRWFLAMPIPHRLVLALLLGGMLVGHFSFDTRTWFPFVTWEIFPKVREEDPVTCRQFIGMTNDAQEKEHRLLVEQLFPSIIQFNPPADNESDTMTNLVHALAAEYNRLHPADPLTRVDLVKTSVKLDGTPPSWQLLKRYEISPGPSR